MDLSFESDDTDETVASNPDIAVLSVKLGRKLRNARMAPVERLEEKV